LRIAALPHEAHAVAGRSLWQPAVRRPTLTCRLEVELSPEGSVQPDRNTILNRVRAALSADEHAAAVWVFGSRARGDSYPGSDLDLGVLDRDGAETVSWRRIALLAERVEVALPGLRADVVLLRNAPLELADRVLREGVLVLDNDPQARSDFSERTLLLWLDDQPMRRQWQRDLVDGLAKRFS
jgi:predicted nucleotidyltransferase